jgi:hypothetical protein
MPQLDFLTFLDQFIFMIFFFLIVLCIIRFLVLPDIRSTQELLKLNFLNNLSFIKDIFFILIKLNHNKNKKIKSFFIFLFSSYKKLYEIFYIKISINFLLNFFCSLFFLNINKKFKKFLFLFFE